MIAADTPPTHGISTAVIAYRGHVAKKPKRLATVKLGYGPLPLFGGPRCTVTYSVLTPYAKSIGIKAITNVWC